MARVPRRPRRSGQRGDRPKRILDYVVATATLCLAIATFTLVWVTRDVAKQTRELVQADIRPVLADVPLGAPPQTIRYDRGLDFPQSYKLRDGAAIHARAWYDQGTLVAGRSIVVRNIGHGPARVEDVRVTVARATDERLRAAWSTVAIIPPGGTARLMTLEINEKVGEPLADYNRFVTDSSNFIITVEYTDIAGHQRQVASAHVIPNYYKIGGLRLYSFSVKNV
jgi:hypothetical protein